VEKNPAALRVAKANAVRLGAESLCFALADFGIPPVPPASLDLLLSNPPYVSEAEYHSLSREVRVFEPKSALVPCSGGSSGLEDANALIELARALLKSGGLLLMEIGCTQGPALLSRLQGPDWTEARLHKDLAGLDRVLAAQRR
jgi:release factor glutamine methyltransferase